MCVCGYDLAVLWGWVLVSRCRSIPCWSEAKRKEEKKGGGGFFERRGCAGVLGAYLDEPDVLALLAEALTADVQAVFADQTSLVGADSAKEERDLC